MQLWGSEGKFLRPSNQARGLCLASRVFGCVGFWFWLLVLCGSAASSDRQRASTEEDKTAGGSRRSPFSFHTAAQEPYFASMCH